MMMSAFSTVPSLWVMMTFVQSGLASDSAFLSSRSVAKSRADTGSSMSRISVSLQTARAMESLCFCPPDRFLPPSCMDEEAPSGSDDTNSEAWAMWMASSISEDVRRPDVEP